MLKLLKKTNLIRFLIKILETSYEPYASYR